MARKGISVYPEHSTLEKNLEYIHLAGKYGFRRLFTCLLSVGNKNREELLSEFRELIDAAHKEGMEVIPDVNPGVFERLNITYDDLSFFHEIHADGIRLDQGFDGKAESLMTYESGLKIELNASGGEGYIDNVMSNHPNRENLITCHNFYPQKYTGLSLEYFRKCNQVMKKYHLQTAAFVSSAEKSAFGPWPVNEGLCTLEMHRDLPIDLQMRHLFAEGIDDVLIANAYATEEELKDCAKIVPGLLTFKVELEKALTDIEHKILTFTHTERGDISGYMIRSSDPRGKYGNADIPPENTRDIQPGDVVILNNNYSRYKGELHIALKPMKNDGRKNVIGHLPKQEVFLLNHRKPRMVFSLQIAEQA